jgi:hypothetical protein
MRKHYSRLAAAPNIILNLSVPRGYSRTFMDLPFMNLTAHNISSLSDNDCIVMPSSPYKYS